MAEELDRNDPDLKYLSVERNQFNDPATQAEWTQKRLVWVPHENQPLNDASSSSNNCDELEGDEERTQSKVYSSLTIYWLRTVDEEFYPLGKRDSLKEKWIDKGEHIGH
uniref:Myosin N-terminal SH3-like domain-containing protein n=1 Tax=Glossina austeni TaxID=7395 RepID=A0A1A9VGN2_GLOAU